MHAYNEKGEPVYQVPNVSKGGMRNTTVTDCRKLGLFPSVTEITGQLDKPALLQWKIDKVLNETLKTPFDADDFFNLDECDKYKRDILRKVAKEAEKAPALGSAIHDELEQWYKAGGDTVPSDRIASAVFAVRDQVGKHDYIAEKSFCHKLGFGGKVDLHANYLFEHETKDNAHYQMNGIVLDFKTKDTLDVKKFKGYKEHIMQLAAYRHGLGIPFADCYNLFISSQDTKIIKLVQYKEEELQQAWEMFKCLLRFWQLNNKMEVRA
tara:strand:+ start:29875 stop:30672 length:798 start_codon:yes stop_codon:yes gene_type:complete